ncbi:MAG TPA: 4-(cytidine 5'-diphospho)-2-C-methyl-D-erythritol kinase [Halanaerobiales bacterium]|nr:4-(cytidine 5'-diphospho)-2-C-methyl-D-erythritol kinase [Halanaerobiales bacterium]
MNKIKLAAPAKINLFLNINSILNDGYHELEMVMQSISLHDLLTIEKIEKGIKLSSNNNKIPLDEKNLAYKAADLILNKYNIAKGVKINIKKNIPVAAGLAGGSTDAAAVLKAISYLYNLNLEKKELYNLGSKIGADVPFCIYGGTAFAYDRGDKLKQLPDISKTWLVLVKPPGEISTPAVYNLYDMMNPDIEIPTQKLLNEFRENKKIDWSAPFGNVLEKVTEKKVSDIITIKEILSKFSPELILMSGSGPSVFAIVKNKQKGEKIVANWPREKDFVGCFHTTRYNTLI